MFVLFAACRHLLSSAGRTAPDASLDIRPLRLPTHPAALLAPARLTQRA